MKNKLKNLKNNFNKTKKYLKKSKKLLIIYMILSCLSIIFGILLPVLYAKLVIKLTSNMLYELALMSILYYILYFINNMIIFFIRKILLKIETNVSYSLRLDVASSVLKFQDSVINKIGTGKIIERMQSDTKEISSSFDDMINQITNLTESIGIFVSIFIINKLMFVYIIIKEIIYITIIKKGAKTLNEKDKDYRKISEDASSFSTELIRGQKDIKMLNSEKSFKNKLNELLTKHTKSSFDKEYVNIRYDFYYDIVFSVLECLELFLMISLIINKELDIANALVIHNYAERTKYLGYSIDYLIKQMNRFNLSCKRVYELIDSPKFIKESFGNTHLDHINGDFMFDNVHFSYDKKEVLKGMTFKVNANTTVAFVGKSGVGKSTIFSLLCKMYDNYTGTIKIDGIDINELDKDSIRGNITVVSQNPYIFNLSIRDNLKLVKEDITEEEMINALKLADLYNFVKDLPNGLDTIVGEGGVNLSGGEKQRLAIARAFIQKTEIILFDEATSSLDNESQKAITNAINNLKKDYTILIIAHRLSTIKNADKIIYIEDGRNVQEGTHEKLLKVCPNYKKLYESEAIKN